jgi:Flp pilus assembly pilin Flp
MRSPMTRRSLADLPEPPLVPDASEPPRTILARFFSDQRGAVLLEYAALTGFVAVVSLPALILCGLAVANSFVFVRGYMLYPFP